MVEGGPIDFLTGDYLAELTLLILWKMKQKDSNTGYALTFVRQMEEVLGTCLDKGIKIVTNAGGLNPAALAAKMHELTDRLGLQARIAHIEGDDILAKLPELQAAGEKLAHLDTGRPLAGSGVQPIAANAYLGAWGIVKPSTQAQTWSSALASRMPHWLWDRLPGTSGGTNRLGPPRVVGGSRAHP